MGSFSGRATDSEIEQIVAGKGSKIVGLGREEEIVECFLVKEDNFVKLT